MDGTNRDSLQVGDIVTGMVTKITNFGAFIDLEGNGSGLIHISQVSHDFVRDINEYLRVGDSVETKVVEIKSDGRVDLSLKALHEPPPRVRIERGQDPEFEKMMKSYLRVSDESQGVLKRRRDSRKG